MIITTSDPIECSHEDPEGVNFGADISPPRLSMASILTPLVDFMTGTWRSTIVCVSMYGCEERQFPISYGITVQSTPR